MHERVKSILMERTLILSVTVFNVALNDLLLHIVHMFVITCVSGVLYFLLVVFGAMFAALVSRTLLDIRFKSQ